MSATPQPTLATLPHQTYHCKRRHVMRGQSTLEYTMFIVAASAALLGMSVYIRRAIQANVKTVENRINQETVGSDVR